MNRRSFPLVVVILILAIVITNSTQQEVVGSASNTKWLADGKTLEIVAPNQDNGSSSSNICLLTTSNPFVKYFVYAFSDTKISLLNRNSKDYYDISGIRYTLIDTSPGMICEGLEYMTSSFVLWNENRYENNNNNNNGIIVSDSSSKMVRNAVDMLCRRSTYNNNQNDDDYDAVECQDENNEICVLTKVANPYFHPCIKIRCITSTSLNFFSQEPEHQKGEKIKIRLDVRFSIRSLQLFVLGFFLIIKAESLSRYRMCHYFLGLFVGISLAVVVAFYLLYKQSNKAIKYIPGGQFLRDALPGLLVIWPQMMQNLAHRYFQMLVYFWNCDIVFGIPHFGKLYVSLFASIGCFLVYWYQIGASEITTISESESDLLYELDEEEDFFVPLTPTQKKLRLLFKLLGVILLCRTTSALETSLLLFVFSFWYSKVYYYIYWDFYYYWWSYQKPGQYSKLISQKEYAAQTKDCTQKALDELRAYLNNNPNEMERVKPKNEIYVRRFAHGQDHMNKSESNNNSNDRRKKARWFSSCTIQ